MSLSLNKATFDNDNSNIDFNDERFWEKVLGPKKCEGLYRDLTEGVLCVSVCDGVGIYVYIVLYIDCIIYSIYSI